MSLNKVQLIGHLGQDPDLRYLPSSVSAANFSRIRSTCGPVIANAS
jgi:single-stranded DNA-binding protein